MRMGDAGSVKPAGLVVKEPRAAKWGSASREAASPTGVTGMRICSAAAITSAVVRAVVHARMAAHTSSRRFHRPSQNPSSGSPIQSARSINVRKSAHCFGVMVQKPTKPSAVGSTDGISTVRDGDGAYGRPRKAAASGA
jgi:hypothetical protein